jgi:CubicO group peptidase (beta-lactamase class C family)
MEIRFAVRITGTSEEGVIVKLLARAGALALGTFLVAAAPASPTRGLNDAVQAAVQAIHATGAQVAVVANGKLILDRGYGVANIDRQVPVTPDTQFEIGSVTKEFTAAAILQLKEQGKLSLTDPLGKYIPEYVRGKNVTIEQLLWQVSGIPEYLATNHFVWISGHKPGGLLPTIALIKNKPLDFKPGTRWAYSNTNYMLLGGVVSRVSHMPWREYVRKNIFARAGMTHSAFIQDEATLPDMATGYQMRKNRLVQAPPLRGEWAGAAGAIVSTVGDLAKWDEAFFGGKIVSMADVKLATTAHVLPSGRSTEYGFGWEVNRVEGQLHVGHSGGTWGFLAQNDYYPSQREFLIALSNSVEAPPDIISAAAFNASNPAIAAALNNPVPGENAKITRLARSWLHRLQTGDIDRSELTPKFSSQIPPAAVPMIKTQLGELGAPTAFVYRGKETSGDVTSYTYRVQFKGATLTFILALNKRGKISGLDFRT